MWLEVVPGSLAAGRVEEEVLPTRRDTGIRIPVATIVLVVGPGDAGQFIFNVSALFPASVSDSQTWSAVTLIGAVMPGPKKMADGFMALYSRGCRTYRHFQAHARGPRRARPRVLRGWQAPRIGVYSRLSA